MKSEKSGKAKFKRPELPHPLTLYTVDEIMGLEYKFIENKFDYGSVQKLVQIYIV